MVVRIVLVPWPDRTAKKKLLRVAGSNQLKPLLLRSMKPDRMRHLALDCRQASDVGSGAIVQRTTVPFATGNQWPRFTFNGIETKISL